MNIYGLFAVLIICTAAVGITLLVCKNGITIHKTSADVTQRPQIVEVSKPEEKSETKKEKPISETSMDAVIKAANELMGINVPDKEDN